MSASPANIIIGQSQEKQAAAGEVTSTPLNTESAPEQNSVRSEIPSSSSLSATKTTEVNEQQNQQQPQQQMTARSETTVVNSQQESRQSADFSTKDTATAKQVR